jgi:glycosyltransferase involved in cell wall biosynthesis
MLEKRMISVIVNAKNPPAQSIQERNIYKTAGCECEYIMFDYTQNANLAAVYNHAATIAKGDILVFIRDDVYFMKMNWGQILEAKYTNDPWLGVVGVAGSQYLYPNKPSLTAAGRPFIKGRVVHHLQNGDFFAVVYSQENGDFEVVAVDGVFMAVKRELFATCQFDATNFNTEHFYDLDFCMQARHTNRILVSTDIVIKRRSQAVFDKDWSAYGSIFLEKWAQELPAASIDAVPDPSNISSTVCVNLKGKAPIETIC